MRPNAIALFILLFFNTAFSGLMMNRAVADWHTRFGNNALAARIEPWEWRHHFRVAIDYMAQARPLDAVASLKRAYPMAPYYWPLINNMALAYAIAGDVDKAEAMWKEVIDMFPQNQIARRNLEVLKAQRGK